MIGEMISFFKLPSYYPIPFENPRESLIPTPLPPSTCTSACSRALPSPPSPDSCSQAVSYMCSETLSFTQELFLQSHNLFSPPQQTFTLLNHLHQQMNMLSNHPSIKSKKRGTFLDPSRPSITGLLGLLFPSHHTSPKSCHSCAHHSSPPVHSIDHSILHFAPTVPSTVF